MMHATYSVKQINRVSVPGRSSKIFSFLVVGHTELPMQRKRGTLCPGIKWPGSEADLSRLSSAIRMCVCVYVELFFPFTIYLPGVTFTEAMAKPYVIDFRTSTAQVMYIM